MLYRLARVCALGAVIAGLCPPAVANTTAALPAAAIRPVAPATAPAPAPAQTAQAGIAAPSAPIEVTPLPAAARIALMLPMNSETLGAAAQAVRAGFLAAYERDKDGILVSLFDTGDAAQDILSAYGDAVIQHDIVVGPLSRSGMAALAQSGTVSKPTIALTQPEIGADTDIVLPRQMLAVGLSVEDEARKVARWAGAARKSGKALVVSSGIAWQRRAAKSFVTQWQKQGRELGTMELISTSGYLSAKGLADLKQQIESERPALVFAALDAGQARQVRAAIGTGIALYGTSQLNPFTMPDFSAHDRNAEMEGALLLDIPWQLQPDHPAVMAYPRPVVSAEQKRSADLERLYALGIDAYRVAREIAGNRRSFEIDGVTGKLTVRFGQSAPFFDRTEQQAMYRDGSVIAVGGPR